ncbi:thiolase family protein [Gordonia sp. LSe1-13]|uniref:Thiolase family protein n=1 Tax=Gordonia sesuvii TaxID=3116777 RepID=A0ABU7MAR0_9ACTN|nr:thiolase family protein [Gordonia sp. LSe1-13]
MSYSGEVAVVGVGVSRQGRHPGRSGNDLAADAFEDALADAGIDKGRVDGLVTCQSLIGYPGDGIDTTLGQILGINPAYSATLDYGTCNFSIHLAAMAISAGLASTVALTYGTVQGTMTGDSGFAGRLQPDSVFGAIDGIGFMSALMFQRHRERFGVTEEQLGAVTVAQRKWASLNPLALRRDEITIDQYMDQPYHVNPIRKLDIAPFDDGGVALILTRGERAGDFPNKPVRLLGMSEIAALRGYQNRDQLDRPWIRTVAEQVYSKAKVGPRDIDIVSIQDPSSVWTMQMLEHFGFVGEGDALPFIAEGHTSPGGSLPVNTGGGHLAESYMWGWLHTVEVVRQLRGGIGDRQVPDAQTAIHCSTAGPIKAAATIYGVD